MAIDPTTSDLYRVGYSENFAKYGLTRYTAASGYTDATFIAPAAEFRDYAINGALRKAYIATSSGVEVFNVDDGEWLETISTAGEARSLSVDEATDTLFVQVGEQSSGRIKEYPAHIVPDATTVSATGEGLVSGTVEALSNGPVTGCTVEYGLGGPKRGEAYEHSVPCSPATPYAEGSTTPITAQLTGLVGETTYHYRVLAANATGTGYGKDKTFVPHYVQNVVTEPCSAVTTATATLNASYDGNGEDTHYFFEWGLKGKPYEHTTADTDAGSPSAHTAVSESISGLTSDTAYHYRVVMSNPKGNSPGNDVECASANAVSSLTTEPVSDLTSSTVTLNGSWDGNGEDTHYFYEWGFATGSGFEHSTPVPRGRRRQQRGPSGPSADPHGPGLRRDLPVPDHRQQQQGDIDGRNADLQDVQIPVGAIPPADEIRNDLDPAQHAGEPERRRRDHLPLRLRDHVGLRLEHPGERVNRLRLDLPRSEPGDLGPVPGDDLSLPDRRHRTRRPLRKRRRPDLHDASGAPDDRRQHGHRTVADRRQDQCRREARLRSDGRLFRIRRIVRPTGSATIPGPALAADNEPHSVSAETVGPLAGHDLPLQGRRDQLQRVGDQL